MTDSVLLTAPMGRGWLIFPNSPQAQSELRGLRPRLVSLTLQSTHYPICLFDCLQKQRFSSERKLELERSWKLSSSTPLVLKIKISS